MRLELPNFTASEPSNARKAVLPSAAFERPETFNFAGIDGDHELSADLMGYPPLSRISCHLPDAADGKPGLAGTRDVVQAGVQNATVVTGLMLADIVLFL
jgi:hypothetical protein